MSNAGLGLSSTSTLCRCGRTTSSDDDKLDRQRLNCGHYTCPDCWHYNEPLPAPLCTTCILAVQGREVVRLSHYVVAFQQLLKQYNELNSAHNQLKSAHSQLEAVHTQQTVEYRDQISRLKRTFLGNLGKGHPTANTSLPLPQTRTRTQTQPQAIAATSAQAITGARVSTSPIASTSKQTINWNSDQAKSVTTYIAKHQELLSASQNECVILKNRIAELTAQLEAKSRPNIDTVTAIEKAELMEAELEGLHERLDKCEEDLSAAQSELTTAKARNAELASEIEQQQTKSNSDRVTMAKAHSHITSLHNEYKNMRDELLLAQKALKAKDTVSSPHADSSQTSIEVSISEKARGKRPEANIPSAADWEECATLLASLQKEVARLKQERAGLDKELSELRQKLKSKEEENEMLGDKLHTSADLAAELGRLHVAASTRAADAESKLLAAEDELRSTKKLIAVREKEKEDLDAVVRVAEFARRAELASRIGTLEEEIANLIKARDAALAQIDDWQQNRGMWKRWGESMALRAKQWEEEAQKARKPATGLQSKVRLEEPPPLTPTPTATTFLPPVPSGEPGHTRKRPHDMPDTDVDGRCDVAQSSGDETVQGRVVRAEGETSGRKKARFSEGLKRGT